MVTKSQDAFQIIDRQWFEGRGEAICTSLLGLFVCIRISPVQAEYLQIHDIELYDGFFDKASHAYRGKTQRNTVMFGHGGFFYVYLCYGMHWMLNIVCSEEDYPSAILIRGAGMYEGPGKLTRALGISKMFNGKPASQESGLWFCRDACQKKKVEFYKTARIGVDYAGPKWSKIHRRYVLNSNPAHYRVSI